MAVVLSVAKLTPGQERYYERSVAAGLDDYYAGPRRVARRLDRPRRQSARARRRRARGRARPADPRPPPAHREAAARTSPAEGAGDHDRADRPAHRRAQHRDEEARPGRRLRPRLLAAEERQPAPRARRRGDPPRGQRGPSDRVAGGARLPRGRGVRDPARRAAACTASTHPGSSPPPTSTARAAPRIRTCTRT